MNESDKAARDFLALVTFVQSGQHDLAVELVKGWNAQIMFNALISGASQMGFVLERATGSQEGAKAWLEALLLGLTES